MDEAGLRERNTPQCAPTAEMAKQAVQELNAEEYHSQKDMKDKRTFGRTSGGIGRCLTATVCCPHSHDERFSTRSHLTDVTADNLLT